MHLFCVFIMKLNTHFLIILELLYQIFKTISTLQMRNV